MRDVEMFSEMTGDRNPLHYDAALAAESPFGGLIVQGGVTSGLLNAIVAEDLPGPGTVFLGVEWRFVKAVGRRRADHRTGRGHRRARRQTDLHTGNQRAQRSRRDLPRRHGRHVYRAVAPAALMLPARAAPCCLALKPRFRGFGDARSPEALQVTFHQIVVATEEEVGSGGCDRIARISLQQTVNRARGLLGAVHQAEQ